MLLLGDFVCGEVFGVGCLKRVLLGDFVLVAGRFWGAFLSAFGGFLFLLGAVLGCLLAGCFWVEAAVAMNGVLFRGPPQERL